MVISGKHKNKALNRNKLLIYNINKMDTQELEQSLNMAYLSAMAYKSNKFIDKIWKQDNLPSKYTANPKVNELVNFINNGNYIKNKPVFVDSLLYSDYSTQLFHFETEKNELVFVCRGTSDKSDVYTDLYAIKHKLYEVIYSNKYLSDNMNNKKRVKENISVHRGFYKQYLTVKDIIRDRVRDYIKLEGIENKKVIFAGHSLGGALATIGSLLTAVHVPENVEIECFTFGSPRVGNSGFVSVFEKYVKTNHRIVNMIDPVPMIPTRWRFRHVYGGKYLKENDITEDWSLKDRILSKIKNIMFCKYNIIDDHKLINYIDNIKNQIELSQDNALVNSDTMDTDSDNEAIEINI